MSISWSKQVEIIVDLIKEYTLDGARPLSLVVLLDFTIPYPIYLHS